MTDQIETMDAMDHEVEMKARAANEMLGHTPRPWQWAACGNPWFLWGAHGRRPVVLDQHSGTLRLRSREGLMVPFYAEHPDARLIEAAPDLLDALLAIGVLPDGWCCCPSDRREDREHVGECAAARTAIAKAGILVNPIEGK